MKALFKTITITGISLLTIGCASPFTANDSNESTNILEPDRPESLQDSELSAKLGYVRYTADEVDEDNRKGKEITIDRTQMADMITRLVLRSGSFEEAASLVTDDEVVIAYESKPEIDEATARDIASRTAKSILPSFYNVHTTDNPLHMDDIHSLHLSTTNKNNEMQIIENIINDINNQQHHSERR